MELADPLKSGSIALPEGGSPDGSQQMKIIAFFFIAVFADETED